jgi:predicted MPP superfamily phosphohydrolase
MKNIIHKLKYPTLGIVGVMVLLIIWSFIEPRILNTENETANLSNLPASWQDKQIGQISDFQIGLWGDNRGTVRRSVTKLIVPGLPQWSWLRFTQHDKVYADGWAKGFGKPGNQLYVNPGIGMSIAPIRLFCPPELTFFTLQAARS